MQSVRHNHSTIGLAAVAALLAFQASAQNPEPAQSTQVVEEILVRGQRLSELEFDLPSYVRDFIAEVVALPPGGGFARWHRKVCVGVHNLDTRAAQYIADRISYLADDVGLKPGEPGCRPDVIIIFTTDANELASYMVENEPLAFRPGGGECCMQLGLGPLDEFAHSDKAVRWWHVSTPVSAMTGERAIVMPQDESGKYPVISVAGPSRIHNGIRDELHHVIIIVDGTKLGGTTWQQIGDYLALVSLAQIDPNADPSAFDSILNLFTNRAAYSGLTDWDRSYVEALYAINLERLPQLQRNEIVAHIARRERDLSE
jgi:hypothetical protein